MPEQVDYESELEHKARWLRLARKLGAERAFFLLARLIYRLRIEGEAYIPAHGACLFPFNHVSDPADMAINLLIRRHRPDVYLFGWQGLKGQNMLTQFLRDVGAHDVQRRTLRAYKACGLSGGELLRALRVLREGGAIAIAAEGELTWDIHWRRARRGWRCAPARRWCPSFPAGDTTCSHAGRWTKCGTPGGSPSAWDNPLFFPPRRSSA
jgi:hypothetical protein